eukprot:c18678_g1_i2 orf=86-1585(+)
MNMVGEEMGGGGCGEAEGLHVVVMPFPLQGHMAPMLQLSNLLAARGMRVTFVHLQSNLSRLHFSRPDQAPTNIRHVSLPDSLPGKATSSAESTRSRVLASEQLLHSFSQLLADLHATSKVSCVIADALMSWALTVGAQMGILGASLWTGALSSCAAYCNIPLLASKGVFPIKDMDGGGALHLIRCIPGLPQIFSFADLPSFFQAPSWPDDVLDFICRQMKLMGKATWVLSNSVSLEPEKELEEEMRKSLPIISVGPLCALHHHHFVGTQISSQHLGAQTRASFWLEDPTCLEWLHGRPSSSVLYISFGSVVSLSPLQIQEIAFGLEASQVPFLWALRPDSIEHNDEGNGKTLSTSLEFDVISRRTGLGLVVPWAPQQDVLKHDAIGGFMTHCGWNSVMESIVMGKPMLGFPRFAEQRMNCKLVEQWQVGKELQVGIHGLVERHEVESCAKLLMNVSEQNSFRSASAKLRVRVLDALAIDIGSSSKNIDTFVNELLEKSK